MSFPDPMIREAHKRDTARPDEAARLDQQATDSEEFRAWLDQAVRYQKPSKTDPEYQQKKARRVRVSAPPSGPHAAVVHPPG